MDERQTPSCGELLREARLSAHLSQTDVARRAKVAQSVISAYESDAREPGVKTFERLIAATGHRLVFNFERLPASANGLPDTRLGRRLRQRRRAILDCVARQGGANPRVFGSVARGTDGPESDVDILVDVPAGIGLFALGSLEHELSQILGARVDLAIANELRPRVLAEAERDAVPL